jgi:cyclopropane fatty-acyl-phospholipid synthase-like methyltransferase
VASPTPTGSGAASASFNLVHHLAPDATATLFRRIGSALKPGTLAVLDVFAEPGRRVSAHADMLALFVYLSPGARVHTPRELDGWLRHAGFAPPRAIRVLRIPGLSLRVAIRSGSA